MSKPSKLFEPLREAPRRESFGQYVPYTEHEKDHSKLVDLLDVAGRRVLITIALRSLMRGRSRDQRRSIVEWISRVVQTLAVEDFGDKTGRYKRGQPDG